MNPRAVARLGVRFVYLPLNVDLAKLVDALA